MRIEPGMWIAVLAGAFVAVPVYLIARDDPDRQPAAAAETEAAASPLAEDALDSRFCAHREPPSGVAVSTGADCAERGPEQRADALAVTVTREPGAVVITAADP